MRVRASCVACACGFADPCSVTWSLPGVGIRTRLDRQHVESDGSDAQQYLNNQSSIVLYMAKKSPASVSKNTSYCCCKIL